MLEVERNLQMYGATEAYLDSLSRGNQQVSPTTNDASTFVIKRGRGCEMHIHQERGTIWIKAILYYGKGDKDRIEEYLVADVKDNHFLLTSRVTHGSVSITTVARRHSLYPLNTLVRMRVK